MSSASDRKTGGQAGTPGGPTRPAKAPRGSRSASSIARSIALSLYVRRFFSFLVFDVLIACALAGAFAFGCVMQMPEEVRADFYEFPLRGSVGATLGTDPFWDCQVVFTDAAGRDYAFPLADALVYAVPVGAVTIVCQVASLFSAPAHTRLIRRKLKPLNDLAMAAEAIGSAAERQAVPPAGVPASSSPSSPQDERAKFASLEHAISEADVDAPSVSTGDKDLRSIEVALNSLLRRMQEAKLQQMRFVSDASHELRTPIAVIQGYVNMLDRWGKTDEAVLDESIEALKSESAHMQELVEQLLFLARGDSGRTTLERAPFDLAELAAEVAEESHMIDADHRYVLDVPDLPAGAGLWQMVGDRAMVKQSMRIVVQNAARYSPPGSEVRISASADGASGRVAYVVQDRGIGMAPADVEHIFERFYRSDAARDKRAGGTGLGLAICKWIVDAHGGSIDVLSHEGLGTRFTVWFPRAGQGMQVE